MNSFRLRALAVVGMSIVTVFAAASGAAAQEIAGRVHLGAQFALASAYVSKPDGADADAGAVLGGGTYVSTRSFVDAVSPLPGLTVGYAVDERWLISLGARITHMNWDFEGVDDITAWSVRPGLRHVFAPGNETRPFIEGALAFGSGSVGDMIMVGADVAAGVQIHFAQRVSVDPYVNLGYTYQHSSDEAGSGLSFQGSTANTFTLSGGFTLSVWL